MTKVFLVDPLNSWVETGEWAASGSLYFALGHQWFSSHAVSVAWLYVASQSLRAPCQGLLDPGAASMSPAVPISLLLLPLLLQGRGHLSLEEPNSLP